MAINNGKMGFAFGLDANDVCFKRKFRWLMRIDGVSADQGASSLPPTKAARPSLSFKEVEAQHLTETIYYPSKPDWKPVNLVLFDINSSAGNNPVWEWIKTVYDAQAGKYQPSVQTQKGLKRDVTLEMYDGCGNVLETWTYENAWPQQIEFGDLDMGSGEVVMVEITLRYDRAFIS